LAHSDLCSVAECRTRHYQQPGPARFQRSPLCLHIGCRQQRLRLRRTWPELVVQHRDELGHADRALPDDASCARDCRQSGCEEEHPAVAWDVPGQYAALHRVAHQRGAHSRRAYILPGLKPWADSRTPALAAWAALLTKEKNRHGRKEKSLEYTN